MIRQIIQSIRLYLNRNGKFYGLSISQIGFVPNNKSLYRLALLHKSASKMTSKGVVLNYERLEFLGDAVLGAIVAELLYKFFPKKDEGFLTRVRSKVVSRESLNELAINIGLDKAVVAKSDISRNIFTEMYSKLLSGRCFWIRDSLIPNGLSRSLSFPISSISKIW